MWPLLDAIEIFFHEAHARTRANKSQVEFTELRTTIFARSTRASARGEKNFARVICYFRFRGEKFFRNSIVTE
jgi:hypothetical protein